MRLFKKNKTQPQSTPGDVFRDELFATDPISVVPMGSHDGKPLLYWQVDNSYSLFWRGETTYETPNAAKMAAEYHYRKVIADLMNAAPETVTP